MFITWIVIGKRIVTLYSKTRNTILNFLNAERSKVTAVVPSERRQYQTQGDEIMHLTVGRKKESLKSYLKMQSSCTQVFPFHAFSQDITNLQNWLIVTSVRFGKKDFIVTLKDNS